MLGAELGSERRSPFGGGYLSESGCELLKIRTLGTVKYNLTVGNSGVLVF